MNVLIVTQSFFPDVDGGSGRFIFEIGRRLAERGHSVTLIGERADWNHRVMESLQGMSVVRYGSPLLSFFLPWSFTEPFLAYSAARVLSRKAEFDIVWSHHYFPGLGGGLFARGRGIPALFTYHASRYIEWTSKAGQTRRFNSICAKILLRWWADWLYSRFALLVERKCLKDSGAITVLSEFSRKQLEILHPFAGKKTTTIPAGVDTERFKAALDRKALKKSLGLPQEGFLILTVRRLIARMGLENLMDAMPIVLRRKPEAYLAIGGRGYLFDSLKERIARQGLHDRVEMLGFIDEAALPEYYASSDLFVLPTLSLEGFGMVTLEALSCGTPVLGTSAGATPEILGPLDRRLILDGAEPDELADGILKFADMGDRETLRARCRAYVEKNYGWQAIADAFEGLMKEMAHHA
jgi:glycosyltransferase involved in cell wall biosynthesis